MIIFCKRSNHGTDNEELISDMVNACKIGDINHCTLLLNSGVTNSQPINDKGQCAIELAIEYGHDQLAQYLFDHIAKRLTIKDLFQYYHDSINNNNEVPKQYAGLLSDLLEQGESLDFEISDVSAVKLAILYRLDDVLDVIASYAYTPSQEEINMAIQTSNINALNLFSHLITEKEVKVAIYNDCPLVIQYYINNHSYLLTKQHYYLAKAISRNDIVMKLSLM